VTTALLIIVTFWQKHPAAFFKPITELQAQSLIEKTAEYQDSLDDSFSSEVINIALLGFDRLESQTQNYYGYRPDTIIIASINLRTAQVNLLSIPRDSYVQIHGTKKYDKINHAYIYGYLSTDNNKIAHDKGMTTTLMTIQDFLGGVPIHNYVSLDMDGAATIVDSIGGVYHDVDVEVRSLDGQGIKLLDKGYQLLDGKHFIIYVRDRADYHGGERGRTQRSQQIIIALFKQFKKEGRLNDLPSLYRTLNQNMETELNITQILALSIFALRVDPDQIKTSVFSGEGQFSNQGGRNIWFFLIDEEKRVELIRDIFGVTVDKRPRLTLPGPVTAKPESELGPETETDLEQHPIDEEPASEEGEKVDKETGELGEDDQREEIVVEEEN